MLYLRAGLLASIALWVPLGTAQAQPVPPTEEPDPKPEEPTTAEEPAPDDDDDPGPTEGGDEPAAAEPSDDAPASPAPSEPALAEPAPPPVPADEPGAAVVPEPEPEPEDPFEDFEAEEVIVTSVARAGATAFQSSVSVSDITESEVRNVGARSTTEIFRSLPGIRSESTGGENNANIQVRGIPVTTGGAKFVQLQEDGLPVLSFGDITFGNADNFLRADATVWRIEAVRGGSASTFASNAPGAVINFLSKTGEEEGGVLGVTRGIDFDTTRADFAYGGPITETLRFHLGGFYRTGEGPRQAGYNAENGGQIKFNMTKDFKKGYARLHFKHLNDRTISYLPAPVSLAGGKAAAIPGFDIRSQSISSRNLLTNRRIDSGEQTTTDLRDGVRSISTALGAEFAFELPGEWTVTDRFRYSDNRGGFVSPFTAGVLDATSVAADNGGTDLVWATGRSAGRTIMNPGGLAGNGYVIDNLLFDVRVDDLSQMVNDLRLERSVETGAGTFDFLVGYYKSIQQVQTAWSFNFFLQEARGENAALIDVVDNSGKEPVTQTVNGARAYGIFDPVFDLTFERDAGFAALVFNRDWFTLDNSVRYEFLRGRGTSNLGSPNEAMGGFVARDIDVNGDGTIAAAETGIGAVDPTNLFAIDYAVDYLSYSFGANFEVDDDLALFARVSRGGVGNGDRLVLGGNGFNNAGGLIDDGIGVDIVQQAEAGLKVRSYDGLLPGYVGAFLTAFWADTEESNFEITSGRSVDRRSRALGAELETAYRSNWFSLTGGLTWTNAQIREDNTNPDNVGNKPRRQADLIYQVTPAFSYLNHAVGANLVGTTSSFAQDNNDLVLPGFAQLNLFLNLELAQGLSASVNVNNATNAFGLTEAEEGSLPANGIVRARAINGRTTTASLRYDF
ncbi:MAG: TonB-dependent receptor [Myxococcales bacterium]|nr:TonB-dependent receptor [Myxococcales bacterium]